jgi:hypothetical protein
MPRVKSWRSVVLGLLLVAGCGHQRVAPDFKMIRATPIMSEAAEQQVAPLEGTALSDYAWSCERYLEYIDALRTGTPE